jgi:hypothetical protein
MAKGEIMIHVEAQDICDHVDTGHVDRHTWPEPEII